MRVAKWGNSLAVRLPAQVVEALELKVGDDLACAVTRPDRVELRRRLTPEELVAEMNRLSAPSDPDYRFDRETANGRDPDR